jgi:hypothetical protein
MLASRRGALRRRGAGAVVLVAVALAVLVAAPIGAWAAPSNGPSRTIFARPATGGLTASALWNGVNIDTANTAGSAFHISFNGAVNIVYNWSQSPVAGPAGEWSINDARLQIFYFGFALATRDITNSAGETSGTITMGNWSTGVLEYVLEGTFSLTASLLATNGTTAWSESFWVDESAPYYILAILPIVLILIAIYELYAIATVGKQQALKRRAKGGATEPPSAAPPSPSPPPSTPPAETGGPETPPPGGAT